MLRCSVESGNSAAGSAGRPSRLLSRHVSGGKTKRGSSWDSSPRPGLPSAPISIWECEFSPIWHCWSYWGAGPQGQKANPFSVSSLQLRKSGAGFKTLDIEFVSLVSSRSPLSLGFHCAISCHRW